MMKRIFTLAAFTGASLLLAGWSFHHSAHKLAGSCPSRSCAAARCPVAAQQPGCPSRPCAAAAQCPPAAQQPGCAVTAPATAQKTDGIFNRAWELNRKSLQGVPVNAEKPQRYITMQIAPDGKISGCSGVNRYFGMVKIDSGKNVIDFKSSPIGSTRMAGPGMAYEDAYLKMLSTVDSYEVKGDKLFLKSAGKTVAEFQD